MVLLTFVSLCWRQPAPAQSGCFLFFSFSELINLARRPLGISNETERCVRRTHTPCCTSSTTRFLLLLCPTPRREGALTSRGAGQTAAADQEVRPERRRRRWSTPLPPVSPGVSVYLPLLRRSSRPTPLSSGRGDFPPL